MKRQWIRLYTDVLENPKVQQLPDRLFRFWVECLLICGCSGDCLPPTQTIAFRMRIGQRQTSARLSKLCEVGLIEQVPDGFRIHDWEEYQYVSDNSTERVQRFRERKRNASENVTETCQSRAETETDTESIDQARINGLAEKLRMDRPSPRSLAAAAVLAATPTELTDPGLAACALALELVPRDHKQRRQCELVLMEASERIAHAEAPRKYAESIVRDLLRRA